MKRLAILSLVGVNLALIAALLIAATPSAKAQAYGGNPDYLMISGELKHGPNALDAIYIIDQAKRQIAVITVDKDRRKLGAYRNSRRNLRRDFGHTEDD
ncbi:MAG: hypothetical protein KGY99_05455 [Phycisphaerae bacterium]|jgi:hypothetical protein|nr:hypothetical protein [Phycisphaerae bacterium]